MNEASSNLLEKTAELINIKSVSKHEKDIVDFLEVKLRAIPNLEVIRIGDNLIGRTNLGHKHRILIGGHSDTVPPSGKWQATIKDETVWGLGATDMKGGVAGMVDLAASHPEPAIDVTYLIYAREEIGSKESGLREVHQQRPDLLMSDVAILAEPTAGNVEEGCQGVLLAKVFLGGQRAHAARPWKGINAIHRLSD